MHRQMPSIQRIWSGPGWFGTRRSVLRTLVYKRTHTGDPDTNGVFGNQDCMGRVRRLPFEAVIGGGGISGEPVAQGIAGKLLKVATIFLPFMRSRSLNTVACQIPRMRQRACVVAPRKK